MLAEQPYVGQRLAPFLLWRWLSVFDEDGRKRESH
jgi:hypothetical protein